ncbi:MAG TPA: L,D-transpeptidase [Candidatus Saccharimonadales bacterium]|nr:L,D-transpeptidase [Candidatus Saccharimonadales bacterium]
MAANGAMVGNEFALPRPRAKTVKVEASVPALTISPKEEVLPSDNLSDNLGDIDDSPKKASYPHSHTHSHPFINFLHRHSFIIMSAGVLIIGSAAIVLGGTVWSAKTVSLSSDTTKVSTSAKPVAGFNLTVPAADFQSKLKTIAGQPVTLAVGQYSEQLNADFVKGWLQITANKDKSEYYIHVNQAAMANSLVQEANTYSRSPVNQLTVNEDGQNVVAVAGQNGRALSDPNGLKAQAKDAAKNVLAGKGLQFNTPLKSQPFQAVTPANFDKLLVANVTSKKLWAYENGKVVNSWLTSDGKPSTPTPLGEFHIYAKFTVQDMRGTNPDGSPYFQPAVPWVNYFYEGSAIHGVYWHPLSWFGAINSSHGCVGLPVDEAKWVFDWAPIGTTVVVNA